MQINRIQVDGILGIQSVDIKLTTPILLCAGQNGNGKSSLAESVRMAITRDHVREVTLKKNFDQLVREGEKAGGAMITIDDGSTFSFNMPAGVFEGAQISEAMRISLYGQRFASMTPDERRTFLFTLTGCRATPELVRTRLTDHNCEAAKIEAVLPMLRTGFPSACEFAAEKATQAKRDWRAQTGATYGAKIADKWKAEKPAAPDTNIESIKKALTATETEISSLNQDQGALTVKARQKADNERKRCELKAKVESIDGVNENLERAVADLQEYEPKVVDMRQRASGTARVGLVHDMARFIKDVSSDSHDPDYADKLVAQYENEHGKIEPAGNIDQEAKNSLPEYERGLEVMQNRVNNLRRDLKTALDAKVAYDALDPDFDEVEADPIEKLEGITGKLKLAQNRKVELQADIRTTEDTLRRIEQADKLTKAAAGHHADVAAWSLIADALAPDGIPGELLAEALKPINSTLQIAAEDTGWQTVKIATDMAITADDRIYSLLSESEKWRVDAMLAQAISKISGLKVIMLDRCDVLDIPNRIALFTWLDELASDGRLETALLFATLKQMPTGMPETFSTVWIENGSIKQLKAAA